MPMPDQHISVITAQSRKHLITKTGMAFKNCNISASKELLDNQAPGLTPRDGSWPNKGGLDTVYYGEYENSGPGSGLNGRVNWPGHHVMDSRLSLDIQDQISF
ncbi:probable pectinesterase/pectinesterase inhibitor 12 [Tanacetum coccineum]